MKWFRSLRFPWFSDEPKHKGLYECAARKCCWRYEKREGGWWGPIWPDDKYPEAVARMRTWADLKESYADCIPRLQRVS